MSYTTKDPDKAKDMEMMRRLMTLETELKIEKEQHALAKQCINYMALQLVAQHQRHPPDASTEETQTRGRRLETPNRIPEFRIRQEIDQRDESQEKQEFEPEDLLDGEGEMQIHSMGPPTTLPSDTPPTPLSPSFDEGFRARCHAFLDRDKAGVKLIDDSDGLQPTLLSLENSGVVNDETSRPDVDNNAQNDRAPKRQREESIQKPLSLENLSDRFKNNKPTIDGVNASRWANIQADKKAKAEIEKRAKVQSAPEDLMSFPELDDQEMPIDEQDFTAAELEEPEDTRTEEEIQAAKQHHAAELRRNQALIMYDPAPSEDSLRTIVASDIPTNMTVADVTRMVCGGIVVKIQSMRTTPLTGNESMLITFLRAKDARDFLASVKENRKPAFRLLETPTYPLNEILADDIMYNGVTRCLAIFDLHRDVTLEMVCNVLRPWGSRDDRTVSVCRDEQGVCHVEFRSVLAALDGGFELRKLSRRFSRVEHGRDPCDRPVPGVIEEEGVKEVGSDEISEDGEIKELEDEDEVKHVFENEDKHESEDESETTAGAESSSKSAVERDADGWPIGELDY